MHAVVFDIDGTLLESATVDDVLYKKAVLAILGDVRFRPTLADYTYVSDSGILQEILIDNAIDDDPGLIAAIKSHFVGSLQSHVATHGPFPEIPGARSMLRRLSESSVHRVAYATGGWRASAQLKLASAGLAEFSFPLASSDDAHDRAEIMKIALASLGTRFDSVTYYGDGPWDQEACVRLGWDFVAVGPALGGLESYGD